MLQQRHLAYSIRSIRLFVIKIHVDNNVNCNIYATIASILDSSIIVKYYSCLKPNYINK